jgi:hypothetical protein
MEVTFPEVSCTCTSAASLKWQFHRIVTMSGRAAARACAYERGGFSLRLALDFAWLHPVRDSEVATAKIACDLLGAFTS